MVSFRFDPRFDAILRDHVLQAARLHGYDARALDAIVQTPEDALSFLRVLGDHHYDAYVEHASLAVDDVGWILLDARTGRELPV